MIKNLAMAGVCMDNEDYYHYEMAIEADRDDRHIDEQTFQNSQFNNGI